MSKKEDRERNVLHAVYSSKTFFKVKQWLESGQMIFSFVNKETKVSEDIYFTADQMMLLCDKILNTTLKKDVDTAAKENKEGYTSPVGGNRTGNKGKPISRYFAITKGNKVDYILTARTFPATENATGAFIPIKGEKALKQIMVPVSSDDLYLIARKWRYLQDNYYRNKFTVENMKSSYNGSSNNGNSNAQLNHQSSGKTQQENTEEKNCTPSEQSKNNSSGSENTYLKKRVTSITLLKEIEKYPGSFALMVKLNGENKKVIFLKDNIDKLKREEWDKFRSLTTTRDKVPFMGTFMEKNGSFYFKNF